jgi:hypothetical protein
MLNSVGTATEVSVYSACLKKTTLRLMRLVGIPYRESIYHCVDCQTISCEVCLDNHDKTHIRTLLRFDNMQWMPKLPEVSPSTPCSYCPKITKTRWECKSCRLALCLKCSTNQERRKVFFDQHRESDPEGRAFFAIYPPYWSTKSKWVADPCPCLEFTSPFHCERCHASKFQGSYAAFVRISCHQLTCSSRCLYA